MGFRQGIKKILGYIDSQSFYYDIKLKKETKKLREENLERTFSLLEQIAEDNKRYAEMIIKNLNDYSAAIEDMERFGLELGKDYDRNNLPPDARKAYDRFNYLTLVIDFNGAESARMAEKEEHIPLIKP